MTTVTPNRNQNRDLQQEPALNHIIDTPSMPALSLASTPSTADSRFDGRLEPKSEYLRKALQDRMEARIRPRFSEETILLSDPTEPPTDIEIEIPQTPSPVRNLPSPEPSLIGDEWMRDMLEDDYLGRSRGSARQSRRRSSLMGLRSLDISSFTSTPSKDVQARMDRLNNDNFDLKHRLALQQDQVKELVNKLEQALGEIKSLKESEEEKELINQKLKEDVEELEKELDEKDAEIRRLHTEKAELFALNDEMAKEMDKKDEAIDEATEMIMQAEEESERVKTELEALIQKQSVAPIKELDSDYYSNEASSPQRRARLKESTDSKLSLSHSDYFSGPSSPHVAPIREPHSPLPPCHMIPTERIPQRKLGPLGERAKSIVRQKVLSSARIQEVRRRLSYASETTESQAEGHDASHGHRRFPAETLPPIRQDASELQHPPLTTRRNPLFRQRESSRGLRALYKEGEHIGSVRQLHTKNAIIAPVVIDSTTEDEAMTATSDTGSGPDIATPSRKSDADRNQQSERGRAPVKAAFPDPPSRPAPPVPTAIAAAAERYFDTSQSVRLTSVAAVAATVVNNGMQRPKISIPKGPVAQPSSREASMLSPSLNKSQRSSDAYTTKDFYFRPVADFRQMSAPETNKAAPCAPILASGVVVDTEFRNARGNTSGAPSSPIAGIDVGGAVQAPLRRNQSRTRKRFGHE